MVFPSLLAYHMPMLPPERTVRQRIIDLLTDARMSSYQLAQRLGIAEREVEGHLPHIVKSLMRDRMRRFVLEPATCFDCGFVFRNRSKLTRPSRCPACRSEGISAPRYGIDSIKRTVAKGRSERLDSRAASE
ncbi:MAG: hypothetical protein NNA22_05375 [Nitrospira sp.]|nr:hypothetical protein [Nitrospira sp.]